ncbi:hypothetical protein KUV74_12335 [Halomonas sp. DP1Y21-3]|uniref:hypothetical protein n=1 Tax=Halomonas sp. DP1Y21-3 TaxID=2859080 RepID=UPI001C97C342|nr:hypothetical protein [Halomonas sp. DP1Y21-3]MBY6111181.1 hypothetical protein [Halomonas sp. DP1Y21-3]
MSIVMKEDITKTDESSLDRAENEGLCMNEVRSPEKKGIKTPPPHAHETEENNSKSSKKPEGFFSKLGKSACKQIGKIKNLFSRKYEKTPIKTSTGEANFKRIFYIELPKPSTTGFHPPPFIRNSGGYCLFPEHKIASNPNEKRLEQPWKQRDS